MDNNYSLDMIVKIIAVGIPALLIGLGFFAYLGGFGVQMVTGNPEMKNTGIVLMAIGILLYVAELVYVTYKEYSEGTSWT